MGFLPWEIRVGFPGERQLRQSRATQPAVHAWCFSVSTIHRTLTWTTGSCARMLMHAIAHGGVGTHGRVVGAPQMISQVSSICLCSPMPSGTWRTAGLPIPWCCLPTPSSVCLVFPPFTVPCKMVLARPDERETWPYHCSVRLFIMVRSSCGPIACRILARTSSLVTWSLYEMGSILR